MTASRRTQAQGGFDPPCPNASPRCRIEHRLPYGHPRERTRKATQDPDVDPPGPTLPADCTRSGLGRGLCHPLRVVASKLRFGRKRVHDRWVEALLEHGQELVPNPIPRDTDVLVRL